MDDLISRKQAIDALNSRKTAEQCKEGEVRNWTVDACVDMIKQLPSAEPKIIHCKDCKYGILEPSFPHQWFCKFKGDEWNNGDYFCGHARKREVAT